MAATKTVALSSMILMALLTTLLSQPAIANAQKSPQNAPAPTIPGLLPPGTSLGALQCWASLTGIEGCVMEIFASIFSLQFGTITAGCCKAFLSVEESCWPKMFPLTPFFPPLLKSICALQVGPAPPALA